MSSLAYIVLDLETDGLDEVSGIILEVAAVGLDEQFHEIFRYSTPITQDGHCWAVSMSDVVAEMHQNSGLVAEVLALSSSLEHPLLDETDDQGLFIHPYIETADELLASVIDLCKSSDVEAVTLAGSGVSHFDHRWIKRHMPETAKRLKHSTIDVGGFRRLYRAVVGDDLTDADSRKTHRALDDVNCHIEELMEFAALFVRDALLRDYAFASTEQETSQ